MLAEAKAVWTRLVEIEPHEGTNYLMLAQSCVKLGDPESAEAALKLAVTMRPEAADGYAMLAQFCLERGTADKARWFAQEALRRERARRDTSSWQTLCRMTGDEAGAEAAHASAQKLSPARQSSGKEVSSSVRPFRRPADGRFEDQVGSAGATAAFGAIRNLCGPMVFRRGKLDSWFRDRFAGAALRVCLLIGCLWVVAVSWPRGARRLPGNRWTARSGLWT